MSEELMTTNQLADYLKVSYRTIQRFIKKNTIPFSRATNRKNVLFRRVDVEQYLAKRKSS